MSRSRREKLKPVKLLSLRLFSGAAVATSLVFLEQFLRVPSESGQVLGFSGLRIVGAFPLLLGVTLGGVGVLISFVSLTGAARLSGWLDNLLDKQRLHGFFLCLVGAGFVCSYVFVRTMSGYPLDQSGGFFAQRFYPLAAWATIFFGLTLLFLLAFRLHENGPILSRILDRPVIVWVSAGFLITYLLFFIAPIFFNEANRMMFPMYVDATRTIGIDLAQYLEFSRSRMVDGIYVGNYTPFTLLFFFPLVYLDFSLAFRIIGLLTLSSFALTIFLIARFLPDLRERKDLLTLFFFTGLISYGLQFEIERAQFNVFAFALALLAIYLFHIRSRKRFVAYLLITVAIQLKIWPAIFVVFLLDKKDNVRGVLKRLAGILTANFLLLFILGFQTFWSFVQGLNSSRSGYVWWGNLSIEAFAIARADWLGVYWKVLEYALFGVIALGVAASLWLSYRRRGSGPNAYLLLVCAIAACLIPSISHDYKMPILAAPMLAVFLAIPQKIEKRSQGFVNVLVLLAALFYSTTLFSYATKPVYLANNLPVLMLLLLATVLIQYLVTMRSASRSSKINR